jgi:hypothetical protein
MKRTVMNFTALKEIISRLMNDASFYGLAHTNPQLAFGAYNLNVQESQVLQGFLNKRGFKPGGGDERSLQSVWS